MDIWLSAVYAVFQPTTLFFIAFGVLLGVVLGAIPGLNSSMGTALLIPFTFAMEPANGISLLAAVYCGGTYGGSISAILFNVPGAPDAAATVFDGYPMAQKGQAGEALGYAIMSSCIGGLFSVVVLNLLAPQLAKVGLTFSQPEYFALAVAALTLVVSLGSAGMAKAFISAILGLLVATVGIDEISAAARFTFGGKALMGGINFIPAIIGAFAVGEILGKAEEGLGLQGKHVHVKVSTKLPRLKDIILLKWTIIRSALIGTMIGILPGVGSITAAFIAYSESARWSKHPEKFGTGIPEGICAPETANNAATGGAMVPLLTLGIPGSTVTAVIIGGFLVHGLQPGPMLFFNQPKLMYTIFFSMYLANILMFFAGLGVAKVFASFLKVRYSILGPCIIVLAAIGSFGIRNDMVDIWIMLAFGILGYVFKKFNYPAAPMIIGMVMGPLTEVSLRRGLRIEQYDLVPFLMRPIAGTILLLALLSVLWSFYSIYIMKSKASK